MDSTDVILMLATEGIKAECREIDYPDLPVEEKEDFDCFKYNKIPIDEKINKFENLFSIGKKLN